MISPAACVCPCPDSYSPMTYCQVSGGDISHGCENLKNFQRGKWSSLTDVTQMHLGREKNCPQMQKMGNLFSRSLHTLTQNSEKVQKKNTNSTFKAFFPTEHNFFQIVFFPLHIHESHQYLHLHYCCSGRRENLKPAKKPTFAPTSEVEIVGNQII